MEFYDVNHISQTIQFVGVEEHSNKWNSRNSLTVVWGNSLHFIPFQSSFEALSFIVGPVKGFLPVLLFSPSFSSSMKKHLIFIPKLSKKDEVRSLFCTLSSPFLAIMKRDDGDDRNVFGLFAASVSERINRNLYHVSSASNSPFRSRRFARWPSDCQLRLAVPSALKYSDVEKVH